MTAINCPVCQGTFKEVNKDGILIDVCTQCKGVWLDRGELEKLLTTVRAHDESLLSAPPPPPNPNYQPRQEYRNAGYDKRHYYDDDDDYRRYKHGHYRKKSKLETLFDIFD